MDVLPAQNAHPESGAPKVIAIPVLDGIGGITRVIKLDKGEGWWPAWQLQVDVSDAAILVEELFHLPFSGVVGQVANIYCGPSRSH